MQRRISLLFSALCLAYPAHAEISLTEIARLPPADQFILQFGDTDHDGRNEVLSTWRDSGFVFFYRIHEEQGQNTYTEEYRGAEAYVLAVGDLDLDGKTDLVGQWDALQVYESLSPDTHPSELVWTHSTSSQLSFITIADTDRDGKPEMIQCMGLGTRTSRIRIFETVGDNQYALVYSLDTHRAGNVLVGDWDGDGLTEIVYCGGTVKFPGSEMTVLESPMDNTWTVTFTHDTGFWFGGAAVGGRDTDGNGRIELFFCGIHANPTGRAVAVYEPVGDNQFERVAFWVFDDGSTGANACTLGNIDGQGLEEVLVEGLHLRVYRATAVGTWSLVQIITNPTGTEFNAQLFDVNNNGLPELFWPSGASDTHSTFVLEYDPTTGTPPGETAAHSRTFVVESPSRTVVKMYVPGWVERIASISVYDVKGRLLERAVPIRDSREMLSWTPRRLGAGVYWIRAETAQHETLAARRVVFLR